MSKGEQCLRWQLGLTGSANWDWDELCSLGLIEDSWVEWVIPAVGGEGPTAGSGTRYL